MNTRKSNNAMAAYRGHHGMATVDHICKIIGDAYPDATDELTGRQYGQMMNAVNYAYHDGKSAAGAWRDSELVGFDDVVLPEEMLKKIRKEEKTEYEYRPYTPTCWGERRYDVDGTPNPQGECYRQVVNVSKYYIGDLLIFTERF